MQGRPLTLGKGRAAPVPFDQNGGRTVLMSNTLERPTDVPNMRLVDLADVATVAAGIDGILALRGVTSPSSTDVAMARAHTVAVLAGIARRRT